VIAVVFALNKIVGTAAGVTGPGAGGLVTIGDGGATGVFFLQLKETTARSKSIRIEGRTNRNFISEPP
jgi:hypothetical protein